MGPDDRRDLLLRLVRDRGAADAAALPELLGASAETVRRDLRVLEARGLVRRTYGRVHTVESGRHETRLDQRRDVNAAEKARIADAAVARMGDARTVYLDEGYQTQLVAERLPADLGLTVLTPSLPIATLLAGRGHDVIVLGGRVRAITSGVVDAWATGMLAQFNLDLAIMGANGVTLDAGMTTPDPSVAHLKRTAVAQARRRLFVGAHHKFEQTTFVTFARPADFEAILTGREVTASVANRFAAAGTPLTRV